MTGADWADPNARAVALYLDGSDAPDRAADGTPLLDDDFLVLVNGWWEPLDFTIPAARDGHDLADGDRHLRSRHTGQPAPRSTRATS